MLMGTMKVRKYVRLQVMAPQLSQDHAKLKKLGEARGRKLRRTTRSAVWSSP